MAPGAVLLRGFALAVDDELERAVAAVAAAAPFRHMETPGGFTHVRRDDELRSLRLGVERERLSLRGAGSRTRSAVASDAAP